MSQIKAAIFGAIGTIAETSDIQRQAFNMAFKEAGLDWIWDAETYGDLLKVNGGQNRIRAYRNADPARASVTDAMVVELHAAKTRHYVAMLDAGSLYPRTGVIELIDAYRREDIPVALCTSTSTDNVDGLRAALASFLPFEWFTTIVTLDQIAQPKPAPDAYIYCLEKLSLTTNEVIAIEDTPVSVASAKNAGIFTVATPGATTSDQDFSAADLVFSSLNLITVEQLSLHKAVASHT